MEVPLAHLSLRIISILPSYVMLILQLYLHLDLQKEVLQHVLLAPHVYRTRIRNQAPTSVFKV